MRQTLVVLVMLAGCGGAQQVEVPPDANTPIRDSGIKAVHDAGTVEDSGFANSEDAGQDAGLVADAGDPAIDAGDPPVDAGDPPVDAGTPDAGPCGTQDAGSTWQACCVIPGTADTLTCRDGNSCVRGIDTQGDWGCAPITCAPYTVGTSGQQAYYVDTSSAGVVYDGWRSTNYCCGSLTAYSAGTQYVCE